MSRFQQVVATHHAESRAVLVAGREPCISVAYDEKANLQGRSFHVIDPNDVRAVARGRSWLMAVILCPGDDTGAIAAWAKAGQQDARRIIFYFHKETDSREALKAWTDASVPVYATWTIKTWRDFHRHFGAAWNVRIFDDFR